MCEKIVFMNTRIIKCLCAALCKPNDCYRFQLLPQSLVELLMSLAYTYIHNNIFFSKLYFQKPSIFSLRHLYSGLPFDYHMRVIVVYNLVRIILTWTTQTIQHFFCYSRPRFTRPIVFRTQPHA